MKINLNDKITRTVVQEYVQSIINYKSKEELDFDVHKLIHTFQVVQIAQELIKFSRPALSAKLKKQILNAAILHDIGRCHEFMDGYPRKGFDHGQAGYLFIKKHFPTLVIEGGCTKWHNKCPSDKDPAHLQPVLDYVRDSDILGNICYNTQHMPVFIQHILGIWKQSSTPLKLDDEIVNAAVEKRHCIYAKMKKFDFLDMMVAQMLWVYNVRTKAALRLTKRFHLFTKYRDTVLSQVIPLIPGTAAEKKKTVQLISSLFPDSLFDEEVKRYDI